MPQTVLDDVRAGIARIATRDGVSFADVQDSTCDVAGYTPTPAETRQALDALIYTREVRYADGLYYHHGTDDTPALPGPPAIPDAERLALALHDQLGMTPGDATRAAYLAVAVLADPAAVDPDPMPVFVLKGTDQLAPVAIAAYQNLCAEAGLRDQAQEVWLALGEIAQWQSRHPEMVQLPDHKHVPAARR